MIIFAEKTTLDHIAVDIFERAAIVIAWDRLGFKVIKNRWGGFTDKDFYIPLVFLDSFVSMYNEHYSKDELLQIEQTVREVQNYASTCEFELSA